MLRDCPWSEKRWDCSKVVQDDVKKKKPVWEKKREEVGCICGSFGLQLRIQGTGLFSVSVAGAGPKKVRNCSTNNCPTL